MGKRIFLSYRSTNRPIAKRLLTFLEENGFYVWIDYKDIQGGETYTEAIKKGVEKCDDFVLIGTPDINESEDVKNELEFAHRFKKTIHQFKVFDFEYSDDIAYYFIRKQWISVYEIGFEKGAELLLQAINGRGSQNREVKVSSRSGNGGDVPLLVSEDLVKLLKEKSARYNYSIYKKYGRRSVEAREGYRELSEKVYEQSFEVITRTRKTTSKSSIIDRIIESANDEDSSEVVFRIDSPAGTGKNHLIQVVFYDMIEQFLNGDSNVLPIYVPIPYFQRKCNVDSQAADSLFDSINEEYKEAIKFCLHHKDDVVPFILVDGIRNYTISNIVPERIIEKVFAKVFNDCDYVKRGISVDCGLTDNQNRLKRNFKIANETPTYLITQKVISTLNKDVACPFISDVLELKGLDASASPEEVMDAFERYRVATIDVFLIETIVQAISSGSFESSSLIEVYEGIALSIVEDDRNKLADIADKTFAFVATNNVFEDEYSNNEWICLARHNSLLDFLLAYNFYCKLDDYKQGDSVSIFTRFYPGSVVKYIESYFAVRPSIQDKVINLLFENFEKVSLKEKSYLLLWASKVTGTQAKAKVLSLIQKEISDVLPKVKKATANFDFVSETSKTLLFYYRTLNISAINLGKNKPLDDYICNCLINDLANDINRGYFLSYYSDLKCDYRETETEFTDNRSLGTNALSMLDRKISFFFQNDKRDKDEAVEFNLFSFYSLLQVRMECDTEYIRKLNLSYYVTNALRYLSLYKKSQSHVESHRIIVYFETVAEDFKEFLKNDRTMNISSLILNRFLDADSIKRQNWSTLSVPHTENISDHLYGAYLIGLFLLPQADPTNENYCKEDILTMLLIHDLGEPTAGDDSILSSEEERYVHDKKEDSEMRKLLQKGTYLAIANMTKYYNLWDEFYVGKTNNAKIAHDIDLIHAIYMYNFYSAKYPGCFSTLEDEKFSELIDDIATEQGKRIYHHLIANNSLFE